MSWRAAGAILASAVFTCLRAAETSTSVPADASLQHHVIRKVSSRGFDGEFRWIAAGNTNAGQLVRREDHSHGTKSEAVGGSLTDGIDSALRTLRKQVFPHREDQPVGERDDVLLQQSAVPTADEQDEDRETASDDAPDEGDSTQPNDGEVDDASGSSNSSDAAGEEDGVIPDNTEGAVNSTDKNVTEDKVSSAENTTAQKKKKDTKKKSKFYEQPLIVGIGIFLFLGIVGVVVFFLMPKQQEKTDAEIAAEEAAQDVSDVGGMPIRATKSTTATSKKR